MDSKSYRTQGGLRIERSSVPLPYDAAARLTDDLAADLDHRRGVLLSSGVEFPGRYTRWDIGFSNPPVMIEARGHGFTITALNARGRLLLPAIAGQLTGPDLRLDTVDAARITGEVVPTTRRFSEEERSRQPSVFSLLRAIRDLFASEEDGHLGLYGAFGYDLVFQFEPVAPVIAREDDHRDLVLFLPDEILAIDHARRQIIRHSYEFATPAGGTAGLTRETTPDPFDQARPSGLPAHRGGDYPPGAYAAEVVRAKESFARGDLFEVVLGQVFAEPCAERPSTLFARLRRDNPAPYAALMNLGRAEFLVSASPEMFVRVEGRRIETCPISGTIARGRDALEDAERIRTLLNSSKDEAELTMCTDVDRNDKSRVCAPGSVRLIGRRQIELYSRLIHTVDHVEGLLRPEFDALDGFLTHAWAVTVTGAPKRGAIAYIERTERSARRWYGGAIGRLTFDGDLNTGLTLRTIRLKHGVAEVRAGATLLMDSDPAAEEAETHLKASAFLAAIRGGARTVTPAEVRPAPRRRVLLVDHEDSFVHTLANYLREAGATVETLRSDLARERLRADDRPDLVVLSPGPGRPADFALSETLDLMLRRGLPGFGVCLGLQGMVEHFGGALDQLAVPVHGRSSTVQVRGGRLLSGLPDRFEVGRYHSLHARRSAMPAVLAVTAETDDGVVMAVEHATLPLAAVQFHPESVMTPAGTIGLPLIRAVLDGLCPGVGIADAA